MKFIKGQNESVYRTRLRESTSRRRVTLKCIILVGLITIIIFLISLICLWRLIRRRSFSIDDQIVKTNCTKCSNQTTSTHQTIQHDLITQTMPIHHGSSTRQTINNIHICASATWAKNGITVAGGRGIGSDLNQLAFPRGTFVDDTDAIYITDDNLRVVKWERNALSGVIVAGFGGRGSNNDQFEYYLHNLAVNKEGTMFICDKGNERVMQWKKNARSGQVILLNINCFGVTLDDEGSLYVSNVDKDLILRHRVTSSTSEVVAGGNGKGVALNQFNRPHFLFVDHNLNIFVPDTDNHRVMKWTIGSNQGIIVSNDNSLLQLSGPHAVVVDEFETIYIVDHDLHRVIRWFKGAQSGEILFGDDGFGDQANQFGFPIDIDFDREGNLYITDRNNHRIQMFSINKTLCN